MDSVISTEGNCKVVLATKDHVERIYPFMRGVDKLEAACMGHNPKEALLHGMASGDVTLTALDPYGVPFAMFGVGRVNGLAYIWCLGTDDIANNSYNWIKASRKYIQSLTKPYRVVFNFVHKDNHQAIRWLKFCGARFLSEMSFNGEPFYEFVITSKEYV